MRHMQRDNRIEFFLEPSFSQSELGMESVLEPRRKIPSTLHAPLTRLLTSNRLTPFSSRRSFIAASTSSGMSDA